MPRNIFGFPIARISSQIINAVGGLPRYTLIDPGRTIRDPMNPNRTIKMNSVQYTFQGTITFQQGNQDGSLVEDQGYRAYIKSGPPLPDGIRPQVGWQIIDTEDNRTFTITNVFYDSAESTYSCNID